MEYNTYTEHKAEQRLRSVIKHIWHQLTDEEIEARKERRDVFFLAIRKKHGLARAQAEMLLNDLRRQHLEVA